MNVIEYQTETLRKQNENSIKFNELKFTGNWFIDAGILGFVNLMEEVYGWDLEELQRRIKEEPEIVYYGYFPFAYFYNLSGENNVQLIKEFITFVEENKLLGKEILEIVWWRYIVEVFRNRWIERKHSIMHESKCVDKRGNPTKHYSDTKYVELIRKREKLLNDLVNYFEKELTKIFGKRKKLIEKEKHNLLIEDVNKLLSFLSSNNSEFSEEFAEKIREISEINTKIKEYLNKIWDDVKSRNIKEESSVFCRLPIDSSFYKNFLFFNNSKGIFEQYEDFKNLLEGNILYSEYLSKIDKTINKFLPSNTEFPNALYVKFSSETISKNIYFLFVYLLNFLNAFIDIRNFGRIFFYANELKFTYHVNKKLRTFMLKASKQNEKDEKLLWITWQAVIDSILEMESVWSLENMYLIKYERMSQQDILGVEYIGISKLQASILLDDTLRDAINANIPINSSNGRIEKSIWLLEEFIKKKPLLPHLIRNVHLYLADRINYTSSRKTLIYASIIDAKLREFGKDNRLFGDYFFDKYRQLLAEIKDDGKWAFGVAKTIKEMIGNLDERKRHANILLKTIKRNDKYQFVNSLLKVLVEKKVDKENIRKLNNFIFSRILPNDLSWRNYSLIFVIGLIAGGESDGSS